jgi:hypothetical protein
MRSALRFLYFLGLIITLIGGAFTLFILAPRLWHPDSEATMLENITFGIYMIGTPLGAWAGLGYLFRRIIPLPCRNCGKAAHAVSLNPLEIHCPHCGDVQRLAFRIQGTS